MGSRYLNKRAFEIDQPRASVDGWFSMANLSELVEKLQVQIHTLMEYLAKENLAQPSFIPGENSFKTSLGILPPDIERARLKAQALSWNISNLLTPPAGHLAGTALQVGPWFTLSNIVL